MVDSEQLMTQERNSITVGAKFSSNPKVSGFTVPVAVLASHQSVDN